MLINLIDVSKKERRMISKPLARAIGKVVQNEDNNIGTATYCRYSQYLSVSVYSVSVSFSSHCTFNWLSEHLFIFCSVSK